MKQTLQNRDHLIVWKVDKTVARLTGRDYVPHRGDIVIFNDPVGDTSGAAGKQLIKRVVALPGERIVMKGTSMTVYNKEHPEGFSPDTDMPYGRLIINERSSNTDYTIGKHQIFVAGDNRDNSHDSRAFGPLEVDNIVGRLAVRILPLNTFKTF
jgi:signal peptidase I